jgi:sugar lactone lactonase YvrE
MTAASVDDHDPAWRVAVDTPALLGESPFWHPAEQCLYYCDIPAHRLQRWDPATGELRHWQFETDVASAAPFRDGSLILAMRDGLWRFDPASGRRTRLAVPPYNPAEQRFNDGKCDPQGRFWVGTLHDRREPQASLFRHGLAPGVLQTMLGGLTVANGLAWSPDGRTLYCSDTTAHTIYAFDTGPSGDIAAQRVFARFPVKQPGQDLARYGGRPDGAAVDEEGCYWVAMFEGQRLLRLSPRGEVLRDSRLPVRCATMPCFGGPLMKTIYLTTARHQRPDAELAAQPLAGCVLAMDVDTPGLPTRFCA